MDSCIPPARIIRLLVAVQQVAAPTLPGTISRSDVVGNAVPKISLAGTLIAVAAAARTLNGPRIR